MQVVVTCQKTIHPSIMLPTPILNQDSKPQKSFQAVVEESILQENSSPKSDKYQSNVSSQIGTDMERLLDRYGMLKWPTTPNVASRYGTGHPEEPEA